MLGRLDLAHRRPIAGLYAGERRSPRFARSPEFSDFRPYTPGDDFRQIDWKAYARLERLMLRLYVAEEESALNVVIDTSASMSMGKWPAAIRLCAALCFLGLAAMDRVAVGTLDRSNRATPHLRGRDGMGRLWNFLRSLEPSGSARPEDLARLRWLRPGLVVVVSDFLTEEPWDSPVAAVRGRRMELVLWQVLSPEEEDPRLSGDVKLVEVEAESARELTITPSLLDEYRANLEAHRERLTHASASRLVTSNSGNTLEATMLAGLKAGLVVRA
jgi:uncharacterized protein (DUF58 family)